MDAWRHKLNNPRSSAYSASSAIQTMQSSIHTQRAAPLCPTNFPVCASTFEAMLEDTDSKPRPSVSSVSSAIQTNAAIDTPTTLNQHINL